MKKEYQFLCLAATLLLAAVVVFIRKLTLAEGLPLSLYLGCALLLMAPLPGEDGAWLRRRMYVFAGVGLVLGALAPAWLGALISVALGVDLCVRLRQKTRRVRRLFRSDEVWNTVLDLSNGLYALWLVAVSTVRVRSWAMAAAVGSLQLGVAVLAFRLRTKDRTVLMNERQVKVMRTIARANLRDPQEFDGTVENRKMAALYKRAVEHMEERKPFLDESFGLEEFAKKLFTNKVYLSRTINALSGRNFRQFVNYYRIRYSTDLARKDPRLKVEELAMMSGFHTVVSYNMAFRLFMNETPSEWLHRYRTSLRN